MRYCVAAPGIWLGTDRGSFVWLEGPGAPRNITWFKSLMDAMDARAKAPALNAIKIIEIEGRRPKGEYVFVICWPDSYLVEIKGEYVRRPDKKNEGVIGREALRFTSLAAAEQTIQGLKFSRSDKPTPLEIYI